MVCLLLELVRFAKNYEEFTFKTVYKYWKKAIQHACCFVKYGAKKNKNQPELSWTDKSNTLSLQTFSFIKDLKELWDKKYTKTNVFRYQVDSFKEKVEGPFLFQLNPYRNVQRRKPEEIDNVCQAFDKNKFNFCKTTSEEVLFHFWRKNKADDVHRLLVNVSPINRFHSLLCPSVNDMLPQMATKESLQLVLDIYFMARDRDLRIGFNGLCAMASVNHLHYHLFFVNQNLPVESVECRNLTGLVWVTLNYPIPAFCFEVSSNTNAKEIYKLIDYFLKKSIAHNIFVTRGQSFTDDFDSVNESTRVFIWPRKSNIGMKHSSEFNVGVCELGGWFPIYSAEEYETINIEYFETELCKWKLDNFDQICEDIKQLF